jgi:probable HAF family extracellular repeat protein
MDSNNVPSYQAFIYENGAMQALGTLGGTESYAFDINDVGQVVGNSNLIGRPNTLNAFLYDDGKMIDLNSWAEIGGGALAHDTLLSAVGINDSGQILVDGLYNSGYGPPEQAAFLLTPIPQTNVPEPGTIGLLSVGLLGLGLASRRRRSPGNRST